MCGKELELAKLIFFMRGHICMCICIAHIYAYAFRFMRPNQIFEKNPMYIVFPILSDLLLQTTPLSAFNCIFSIHMPIFRCLVPRLVCISSIKWLRFLTQGQINQNSFHSNCGKPIQIFSLSEY